MNWMNDSRDCVDVISDGPGDKTVRPMSPELKRLAQQRQERVERWQAELKHKSAASSDDVAT